MARERVHEFYRRQAAIYDATRPFFLPARALAIERLGVRPGHRVADLGCGTGLNFPRILRARPGRLVGVDASPAMLARAAAKHRDVETIEGDLATVSLGAPFDRILCTYALSLVDDWEAALANARRHLAPDGVLVLLDFDRLTGPLGWADPALRAWLKRFHVRVDRPVADRLRRDFADVRVEPRWSGYVAVTTARG